jgi:FtsH-binding integral membrane protein
VITVEYDQKDVIIAIVLTTFIFFVFTAIASKSNIDMTEKLAMLWVFLPFLVSVFLTIEILYISKFNHLLIALFGVIVYALGISIETQLVVKEKISLEEYHFFGEYFRFNLYRMKLIIFDIFRFQSIL